MLTVGTLGGKTRHGPPRLEAFSYLLPIDWCPNRCRPGRKWDVMVP